MICGFINVRWRLQEAMHRACSKCSVKAAAACWDAVETVTDALGAPPADGGEDAGQPDGVTSSSEPDLVKVCAA